MTVKELIRHLRRFSPDMKVGVALHDNTESELQGMVNSVGELEPGTSRDWHGEVVVIRT